METDHSLQASKKMEIDKLNQVKDRINELARASESQHDSLKDEFNKFIESNQLMTYIREHAKDNHKEAQYILGLLYFYGYVVEENEEKALEWFKKSAEQGHRVAQYK